MKRRYVYFLILTVILVCAFSGGCKKKSENRPSLAGISETKPKDESASSVSEDELPKPKEVSEDFETSREQAKDKEQDNKEAEKAYMELVSDERLFVSDIEKKGWFREGNRYGFSEMIDIYPQSEFTGEDLEQCGLKDAYYSYIDCADNGTEEMAVKLIYQLPYGEWNLIHFFCYEDGEVRLMGSDEWGYRSELTVNRYGYVENGGSGGASLYVTDAYFFNKDNKRTFLFSREQQMGLATPMVPKYFLKNGFDRTDYPENEYDQHGDGYCTYIYSLKEVIYDDYDYDNMYENYYKDYMYSFADRYDKSATPRQEFIDLYKKEGVKWYDFDELEEMVRQHEADLGADDHIINGGPVSWESLVNTGRLKHSLFEEKKEEDDPQANVIFYTIKDDHPKPYVSKNAPSPTPYEQVKLEQASCKENDITDVEAWFKRAGYNKLGTQFDAGKYSFELTGDAAYGTMTQINVYDKEDKTWLYNFDFSDFLYEDGYENTDYVDRGIHSCFITDNLLYLNMYHRTYSADCPANAFIICVNIDNGEVIWISNPLVANSVSFVRWGDNIITGYGFTAEDDYIYTLNRFNGEITSKLKVKKSPDYFLFVGDDLWVRTYSYDYIFKIKN